MATSRMRKTAGRMGNGHRPEVVEGEKGLRSLSEVVMGLSASMMWWCGVLVGGGGEGDHHRQEGLLVSLSPCVFLLPRGVWAACFACPQHEAVSRPMGWMKSVTGRGRPHRCGASQWNDVGHVQRQRGGRRRPGSQAPSCNQLYPDSVVVVVVVSPLW